MARRRADVLAVEQGLAPTRNRAQALILAGALMAGPDRKVAKAGELLEETTELWLREEPLKYVSRGGLKLEAALERFRVDPKDLVCLDVGASTGGFTDCLLQRGARRVYALDVGYGQLAWSLRQDPRVVVLERTNVRELAVLPEPCQLVVIDVSFISLKLVLPKVKALVAPGAQLCALVKPQFEVGRADVGKGGIVRDEAARARALAEVVSSCKELGMTELATMDSPIRGQKGNHEYLLAARFPSAMPL
jgi:23S rRNA (cytidine1920-2'-O)/16S rRNA (cytidine1409-2'-O)-methyltransferase